MESYLLGIVKVKRIFVDVIGASRWKNGWAHPETPRRTT